MGLRLCTSGGCQRELAHNQGGRSRAPGGMARSTAGSCGTCSRPSAPAHGLLRSRLRRFLAGAHPAEGRHPDGGVRSGELPEAAPWPAKTDRLDAEEMTRILRSWLGGDSSVARDVRIPTVE